MADGTSTGATSTGNTSSMAGKARIAVIGTGWWATSIHLPVLVEHGDVELIAVCDTDPDKLAMVRDRFAIPRSYESHEQLLASEDVDGVVVATSHAHHYAVAKAALVRGAHVMIEKPMTIRAAEARELVDLARRQSRQIIVGYTCSYLPNARAARRIIRNGEIGRTQLIISQYCSNVQHLLRGDDEPFSHRGLVAPSKAYSRPDLSGGGHGQTQLTHAIGLVFWLLDVHAVKVSGFMKSHGLAVDLVDALAVEFDGDVVGSFTGIGNARAHKTHDLQIYGDRGHVEMQVMGRQARVHRYEQRHNSPEHHAEDCGWPLDGPVRNLVDVVLGRDENHSPGDMGWRAVEVLEAAYRSVEQGGAAVPVASLYSSQEPA